MLQTQSRPFNVCNCEDVEKDGKDQFSLRDEISSPATPTQDIPEQQRSLEDLDPRIFAPTGDIYRFHLPIQLTTSSCRQNGGAYCGAAVGGKCMVSKAKFVIYEFAM